LGYKPPGETGGFFLSNYKIFFIRIIQ